MPSSKSRLSQAIEHDCIELCVRNGLAGQEIRTALHIADDLARRASLSSNEVMQIDEFWQYISIQRQTVIDPSDALRRKVISAIIGRQERERLINV